MKLDILKEAISTGKIEWRKHVFESDYKAMKEDICPVCGGVKTDSTTSFTVDYNSGVVIVRNVPSSACSQCGEEWIADNTAEKLEEIVSIAKKQK